MKEKKLNLKNIKEKILNLANIIGALFFTVVAVIFFFAPARNYPFIAQLAGLTAAAGLAIAYARYSQIKPPEFIKKMSPRQLYLICAVISLVIQIIIVLSSDYIPRTDPLHMDKICRNFVNGETNLYKGLDLYHQHYLERYSNNWGIFLIQTLIYKASVFIFGDMKRILLSFANIAALQLSYFLTYKTSQLVFERKKQKILLVLMLFCCPVLYSFTCVFYTDTVSMPFVMLTIYFLIKAVKEKSRGRFLVYSLISALSAAVGYSIKGSAAVIAVAAIIYMFFKTDFKRTAVFTVCVVLAFGGVSSAVSTIMYSTGAISEENVSEYGFPMTHWVMMGLKNRGGYDVEEFRFTYSISGKEEKKQANLEVIRERFDDYGASGLLKHLYKKLKYTWHTGTYQSTVQYSQSPDSFFKKLFSSSPG